MSSLSSQMWQLNSTGYFKKFFLTFFCQLNNFSNALIFVYNFQKYYSQQQQQRSEATNSSLKPTSESANIHAMSGNGATIASINPSPLANANNQKQLLMIQEFSSQSRLNIEWSK